jgi:hypothetical protein
VLSAYLLTANGHIQTIDVTQTLQTARHMVGDGELTVDTPFALPGGSVKGVDGKAYSGHGIGMSLLFLPIAKLDDLISPADDPELVPFLASLLNPLAGTLVVLLFFALERRLGVALLPALAAALLLAFASICWPYAHVSFDAVPTHAAILGTALCLVRWTESRSSGWVLGASGCLAIAVLIRLDSILLAPVLAAVVVWPALRRAGPVRLRLRRAAPPALAWAGPIAVALGVTGWFNQVRFGSPFDTGHTGDPVTRLTTPIWTGLAGQLVSPGKGIVWYAPLVVVAALGWPLLIRRRGALAWGLLASAVVTIGFHAVFANWSGDEAWGPRYTVPVIGLLMLPLGSVLQGWRGLLPRWRAAITVVAAVSFGVQLLGVGVDYLAVKRDTVDGEAGHWAPGSSPLVSHARSLSRSVRGEAPYPGRAAGGITADPVPVFDVWWVANTYGKHHDFERAVPLLAFGLFGSAAFLAHDTRRRHRDARPAMDARDGRPA